jgi:hypothetical protein
VFNRCENSSDVMIAFDFRKHAHPQGLGFDPRYAVLFPVPHRRRPFSFYGTMEMPLTASAMGSAAPEKPSVSPALLIPLSVGFFTFPLTA